MILVTLTLLVVVSVLVVRGVGGVHEADRIERTYVAFSPLPWVASTLIPAAVGLSGVASELSGRRAIWIGVGVSVVFAVVGAWLVVRRMVARTSWGWPLGAAVVLAASPFLFVALSSGLLWVMGRMR